MLLKLVVSTVFTRRLVDEGLYQRRSRKIRQPQFLALNGFFKNQSGILKVF